MQEEILKEINQVLSNQVVDRHSMFQLKHFVVGKEPTHQSRLWRCVKELEARIDSIKSLTRDLADTNDTMEITDIEIEKINRELSHGLVKDETVYPLDDLMEKQAKIRLRQLNRKKEAIQENITAISKKIKYAEEESIFFLKSFQELSKIEVIKPFDDLESQLKYWEEKFSQELQLKLLLRLPIDVELAKAILSLDSNSQIRKNLTLMFDNQQKVLTKNGK